ncbi:hypothetical protein GA0115246_100373 [Streptomyces sp. SolWspMP-sol7th]|nr:hypothetical protein GA0115246_100373 [Streptomyces sp. SolWspMP-sol7th]
MPVGTGKSTPVWYPFDQEEPAARYCVPVPAETGAVRRWPVLAAFRGAAAFSAFLGSAFLGAVFLGSVFCGSAFFGAAFFSGTRSAVRGPGLPERARCWPGRIRSGSAPTVPRFSAYSCSQPPSTCRSAAMPERLSPGTTVYSRAVPARDCGVLSGPWLAGGLRVVSRSALAAAFSFGRAWGTAFGAASVFVSVFGFARALAGCTAGAGPPRASPARGPQVGQACGPWLLSTFSATTICSARVAWSARDAYALPPNAFHVLVVNWSPP